MMDRDQLKEAQAPLKERYRDDAETALVTLSAVGELGEGVSCSLSSGRALGEAGLHPAAGGDGSLLYWDPVGRDRTTGLCTITVYPRVLR